MRSPKDDTAIKRRLSLKLLLAANAATLGPSATTLGASAITLVGDPRRRVLT